MNNKWLVRLYNKIYSLLYDWLNNKLYNQLLLDYIVEYKVKFYMYYYYWMIVISDEKLSSLIKDINKSTKYLRSKISENCYIQRLWAIYKPQICKKIYQCETENPANQMIEIYVLFFISKLADFE